MSVLLVWVEVGESCRIISFGWPAESLEDVCLAGSRKSYGQRDQVKFRTMESGGEARTPDLFLYHTYNIHCVTWHHIQRRSRTTYAQVMYE